MSKINVILVDDHKLLLEGFKSTLSSFNINVVKTLYSSKGVIESYRTYKPDIMVIDIRLGNNDNGLILCKNLINKYPNINIIVLSQFDQIHIIKEAYEIGVKAFIKKDEDTKILLEAIAISSKGETYYSSTIAQELAKYSTSTQHPFKLLSKRELKIFLIIAQGSNLSSTAKSMKVSKKTITNILAGIKTKLNVTRSSEFTKLAIKFKIINIAGNIQKQ